MTTTPDFRAHCARLIKIVEDHCNPDEYALLDVVCTLTDARAALATPPPEPGKPTAWMYQGEDDFDGICWRENWEVTIDEKLARFKSGNKEPIPLFKAHDLAPPPEPPTDQEIEEWAEAAEEVPLEEMDPDIHGWPARCFTKEEFCDSIRAALKRWGNG